MQKKRNTLTPEEKKYKRVNAWQEQIAEMLFILLMCALPTFLTSDRYIGLTGQKFWFFFSCMCAVIVCVIVVWIYRIAKEPWILPDEKPTITDWAIIAFAIITLLSALFSPFKDVANVWIGKEEPNGRYDGAITQIMYVIAFLVIAKWYKPRMRDFIIFGFSAVIVSSLGIFQFYGMDFFRLWPMHIPEYNYGNYYNIWFRSTLGNINIVSTYACVATLLCGGLYLKIASRWRFLWLAGSALSVWLMILARSDSGVFGTAIAMAIATPFLIRDIKCLGRILILGSTFLLAYTLQKLLYDVRVVMTVPIESMYPYIAGIIVLLAGGLSAVKFGKEAVPDAHPRWKLRIAVLAGIIISAIIGIELVGRNESLTIVFQIREIMHGRFEDHYASHRIFLLRHSFAAFTNHPIIGTGPDTFRWAVAPEAHTTYNVVMDKAHNEYAQILVCQGILGLLCYLVFLGGVFIKAIPNILKNPLIMVIAIAFTGYCVQAIFNISLPIATPMMWVLAGIMVNRQAQSFIIGISENSSGVRRDTAS